jgi:threonine dehydratase
MCSCQVDALTGNRVILKREIFQRGNAFKFRRAYHEIVRLMSSQPSRVLATVSSGIVGKDCAGLSSSGTTAHIVMPKPFSVMKHRAVLGYGA